MYDIIHSWKNFTLEWILIFNLTPAVVGVIWNKMYQSAVLSSRPGHSRSSAVINPLVCFVTIVTTTTVIINPHCWKLQTFIPNFPFSSRRERGENTFSPNAVPAQQTVRTRKSFLRLIHANTLSETIYQRKLPTHTISFSLRCRTQPAHGHVGVCVRRKTPKCFLLCNIIAIIISDGLSFRRTSTSPLDEILM